MGNEKNKDLTAKLKKAYIGGHSNLKVDISVTVPKKGFNNKSLDCTNGMVAPSSR